MKDKKDVFYSHENFGELSKEELDLYLVFLADVLHSLSGFDVWEAENCHSEEDNEKYKTEVIERFQELLEEKYKLENKIYGAF